MSEPFLAEIRIVGFNFAPRGWAFCDGQLLPISQNQSLFALLGTIYGGDGRTTFALPDLRSRTPIHEGNGHNLGQKSGQENVALTVQQLPQHNHVVQASFANADSPHGGVTGGTVDVHNALASANNLYGEVGTPTNLRDGTAGNAGGSQGHNNMQPYLALNFCIALQGIFPSRN